jgi:hypothetical protein
MHYCGSNLISFYFGGKVKSCCGDKCKNCHDKTLQLKIADNFTKPLSNTVSNFRFFFFCIFSTDVLEQKTYCDFSSSIKYPYSSSPPLYKFSNSFLEVFRL